MQSQLNLRRRDFLRVSAAGAAALSSGVWSELTAQDSNSPNEKLNIGCVGTANRASADINGVAGENIVAVCDVDRNYLGRAAQRFPDAKTYTDYREMIDKEADKLDAVVVGTADHNHAPATIRAIRAGLHTYCEKPLTHTVAESRIVAEAAKEMGVATQMGTQIHAGDNYRRVVEVIQSGAIGDVTETHVWVGKAWGGGERPEGGQEPPASLDWDLWLGPAPERLLAGRLPSGQLAALVGLRHRHPGRHGLPLHGSALLALKLRHPTSCEAEGPPVHPETCPLGLIVRFEFPKREGMPACKLTWYDGNMIPKQVAGERVPGNGVMFVGSEGMMYANYGSYKLFPAAKFAGYKPPAPSIPKSIGHHAEWIKACKDGSPTTCNFDYSGALSESVLLGNVAYRVGKKLEWDAAKLRATNCPEADKYIRKQYRKGWEVVGKVA